MAATQAFLKENVLKYYSQPRAGIVKVLGHLWGPREDGTLMKEVADSKLYAKALFTKESIEYFNTGYDDSFCSSPPDWDHALLLLNEHRVVFQPSTDPENEEGCPRFILQIEHFTLVDLNEGFYSKNTVYDLMRETEVKKKAEEMERLHKQQAESQDTTGESLTQLIEALGQASMPVDDALQVVSHTPAQHSPARADEGFTDGTAQYVHQYQTLEEAGQTMCTLNVDDFLVSSEDQTVLDSIPEWQADYIPSSCGSSADNNEQMRLVASAPSFDSDSFQAEQPRAQPTLVSEGPQSSAKPCSKTVTGLENQPIIAGPDGADIPVSAAKTSPGEGTTCHEDRGLPLLTHSPPEGFMHQEVLVEVQKSNTEDANSTGEGDGSFENTHQQGAGSTDLLGYIGTQSADNARTSQDQQEACKAANSSCGEERKQSTPCEESGLDITEVPSGESSAESQHHPSVSFTCSSPDLDTSIRSADWQHQASVSSPDGCSSSGVPIQSKFAGVQPTEGQVVQRAGSGDNTSDLTGQTPADRQREQCVSGDDTINCVGQRQSYQHVCVNNRGIVYIPESEIQSSGASQQHSAQTDEGTGKIIPAVNPLSPTVPCTAVDTESIIKQPVNQPDPTTLSHAVDTESRTSQAIPASSPTVPSVQLSGGPCGTERANTSPDSTSHSTEKTQEFSVILSQGFSPSDYLPQHLLPDSEVCRTEIENDFDQPAEKTVSSTSVCAVRDQENTVDAADLHVDDTDLSEEKSSANSDQRENKYNAVDTKEKSQAGEGSRVKRDRNIFTAFVSDSSDEMASPDRVMHSAQKQSNVGVKLLDLRELSPTERSVMRRARRATAKAVVHTDQEEEERIKQLLSEGANMLAHSETSLDKEKSISGLRAGRPIGGSEKSALPMSFLTSKSPDEEEDVSYGQILVNDSDVEDETLEAAQKHRKEKSVKEIKQSKHVRNVTESADPVLSDDSDLEEEEVKVLQVLRKKKSAGEGKQSNSANPFCPTVPTTIEGHSGAKWVRNAAGSVDAEVPVASQDKIVLSSSDGSTRGKVVVEDTESSQNPSSGECIVLSSSEDDSAQMLDQASGKNYVRNNTTTVICRDAEVSSPRKSIDLTVQETETEECQSAQSRKRKRKGALVAVGNQNNSEERTLREDDDGVTCKRSRPAGAADTEGLQKENDASTASHSASKSISPDFSDTESKRKKDGEKESTAVRFGKNAKEMCTSGLAEEKTAPRTVGKSSVTEATREECQALCGPSTSSTLARDGEHVAEDGERVLFRKLVSSNRSCTEIRRSIVAKCLQFALSGGNDRASKGLLQPRDSASRKRPPHEQRSSVDTDTPAKYQKALSPRAPKATDSSHVCPSAGTALSQELRSRKSSESRRSQKDSGRQRSVDASQDTQLKKAQSHKLSGESPSQKSRVVKSPSKQGEESSVYQRFYDFTLTGICDNPLEKLEEILMEPGN